MSKFTGKLSYKNWCIVKHTLERDIAVLEVVLECCATKNEEIEALRELEESKRCLRAISDIVANCQDIIGKN